MLLAASAPVNTGVTKEQVFRALKERNLKVRKSPELGPWVVDHPKLRMNLHGMEVFDKASQRKTFHGLLLVQLTLGRPVPADEAVRLTLAARDGGVDLQLFLSGYAVMSFWNLNNLTTTESLGLALEKELLSAIKVREELTKFKPKIAVDGPWQGNARLDPSFVMKMVHEPDILYIGEQRGWGVGNRLGGSRGWTIEYKFAEVKVWLCRGLILDVANEGSFDMIWRRQGERMELEPFLREGLAVSGMQGSIEGNELRLWKSVDLSECKTVANVISEVEAFAAQIERIAALAGHDHSSNVNV